jgi:hypothetical protein
MTAILDLVEDGQDVATAPRPPRFRWLPIVLSFVAGLGLGVITLGSDQQAAQRNGSEPTTVEQDLEQAASGQGITDVIPGFSGSLVAIATTENSAFDRILWPTGALPIVRPMARGDNVTLDARAQFIAMTTVVPGLDGAVLSMGRFNLIRAISSGVTSFAWHDHDPGLLSYTTEDRLGTHISTINSRGLKSQIPWVGPPGVHIVSWGEWGWAIQMSDEQLVLIAPDGVFKDSEPGRAFASLPAGWIFVIEDSSAKFVSAGGGVKRVSVAVDFGIVADASFSPVGNKVAVAGSKGIVMLDRTTEELTLISDTSTQWVSWSPDSRFILSSAPTGINVYDTKTGSTKRVLTSYAILAARGGA